MSEWAEKLAIEASDDDARVEATWKQLNADLNDAVETMNKKVAEDSPHHLSLTLGHDEATLASKNGNSVTFALNRATSTLALRATWLTKMSIPKVEFSLAQPAGFLRGFGSPYPNLIQKVQIATSEIVERVVKDVDNLR